jgi:uncharacterized damage-inducible protein DinB
MAIPRSGANTKTASKLVYTIGITQAGSFGRNTTAAACPTSFATHRKWLDSIIVRWVQSIAESDLDFVMRYTNSRGEMADKSFFGLVMHFFNHQTHHRGQVTTLFSQDGIDVGVTDLLAIVPNRSGV